MTLGHPVGRSAVGQPRTTMQSKLYNLAWMTTATVGPGTITLGSAVPSYLSFDRAGVQNGDTVTYAIDDGSQREMGYGVYNVATKTLTRDVIKSTNDDNPIQLSGRASVCITAAAEDIGPEGAQGPPGPPGGTPTYSMQRFVTAGAATYTTPADSTTLTVYRMRMVGGGGGGGGQAAGSSNLPGGGGGGQSKEFIVAGLAPNTALPITVGAAGTSTQAGATAGNGGNTSITIGGQAVVCNGGAGGRNGNLDFFGGAGGNGGATPAIASLTLLLDLPGQSGDSGGPYFHGSGGSSMLGFGGQGQNNAAANLVGRGYGAGGCGAPTPTAGGAGTIGAVIVERIQG